MKIAIMTWFSYGNYGTLLQAYALSQVLKDEGHTADIIRYYPKKPAVDANDRGLFLKILDRSYKEIQNIINPQILNDRYDELFEPFADRFLTFTKECETLSDLKNVVNEYDVFICGSDQIWTQENFDSHYFLDFVEKRKKTISYAPSMGAGCFKNYLYEEKIKELVHNIDYVSVREESSTRLLKASEKEIIRVVDPTLLLSSKVWEDTFDLKTTDTHENSYALLFFLGRNNKSWKTAYELARKKNLKIKVIPAYKKDFGRKVDVEKKVDPKRFMELIKNASLICTDSFHGIVFSIIFEKDFLAFERFKGEHSLNQNNRIYDLLNSIMLTDRIVQGNTNIEISKIDYAKKKEILLQKIGQSKNFLFSSLSETAGDIDNGKIEFSIGDCKSTCIGCGGCLYNCPTNAINIKLEKDGFFRAEVDQEKCIHCNRCFEICPFTGAVGANSLVKNKLYAYQDCDETLKSTSSGGAAYRISELLLSSGYTIIGCTYDYEKNIAKHIVVKEEKKLSLLKGSKYIQSFFADAFEYIGLNNEPTVVFGTPCQIGALKKVFPERENIIYIELICHGVPTYNLLKKYVEYLKKTKKIKGNIKIIKFRDKTRGWHKKTMHIMSDSKQYYGKSDLFFRMYNSGVCYCDACYECRWREKSSADLRLGDFWGGKFRKDKLGVSMVIPNSIKGEEIVTMLKNYEEKKIFLEQDISDYYRSQQVYNLKKPLHYEEIIDGLQKEDCNLEKIVKKYADPVCRKNSFYDKVLRIYGKKK